MEGEPICHDGVDPRDQWWVGIMRNAMGGMVFLYASEGVT